MQQSPERILVAVWIAVGVAALILGAVGEADDRVMQPLAAGGVVAALCVAVVVSLLTVRSAHRRIVARMRELEESVKIQNTVETELRRTVQEAASAAAGGSAAITDPESGLLNETYLRAALVGRVHNARRHLRPLAYVMVHVGADPGAPGRAEPQPSRVATVLDDTLRDADTSCRLDDGLYGLLLEDTPEDGAVWTLERVRRNLADKLPGAVVWAGVATYPAHATDADELAATARDALARAREWAQSRIEVAARIG